MYIIIYLYTSAVAYTYICINVYTYIYIYKSAAAFIIKIFYSRKFQRRARWKRKQILINFSSAKLRTSGGKREGGGGRGHRLQNSASIEGYRSCCLSASFGTIKGPAEPPSHSHLPAEPLLYYSLTLPLNYMYKYITPLLLNLIYIILPMGMS